MLQQIRMRRLSVTECSLGLRRVSIRASRREPETKEKSDERVAPTHLSPQVTRDQGVPTGTLISNSSNSPPDARTARTVTADELTVTIKKWYADVHRSAPGSTRT